MKGRKRRFSPYATQHIYHRCKDLGVLFYSTKDRIVYYTLAATKARKKRIRVLAASLMFTHLHESAQAPSKLDLECYLRNTDSSFARLYNKHYGRKESVLFDKPPGCAQKMTTKEKRSNIIYVFNNHVEKGLCKDPREERWSFLAYAFSDHPFSEKLDMKRTSSALRKALRLVNRRIVKNKALEYTDLDRIFPALDEVEMEQFIDYVIYHYAWIDFRATLSYFDSEEDIVKALHSVTGGEYDINEDYSSQNDLDYIELLDFAERNSLSERLFSMTPREKMDWAFEARRCTSASDDHLRRFFHIDFRRAR